MLYDVARVRRAFPILQRTVNDRPLVYLDSAATALKPESVMAAEMRYYREFGANVHRGRHALSEEASHALETARRTITRFLGARSPREVVFSWNATSAMNMVVDGLDIGPEDEVITTIGEHHSTLVPWMRRAKLRWVPGQFDEPVDPEALRKLINERTRAVVLAHVSNVTGLIQPVADVCRVCREAGVLSVIDAAQSAPHLPLDIRKLDCDFLVLSGHKMLGPTGTGVLWGREDALGALRPSSLGGGVVHRVSRHGFELRDLPARLEAGTPNIAGILGLAAAASFLEELGWDAVQRHADALCAAFDAGLQDLPGAHLLRPRTGRSVPIASLYFEGLTVSLDDLTIALSDSHGIMTRAGFQCAQPLCESLRIPQGVMRASAYIYNTVDEIERFCSAIRNLLVAFMPASPAAPRSAHGEVGHWTRRVS